MFVICFHYDKDPNCYDLVDQLKTNGYLQGRLVNHVWSEYQSDERHQLLDVMEQFDMICAAPSDGKQLDMPALGYTDTDTGAAFPIYKRNYYVPSLFNPKDIKGTPGLAALASLTFYVDFNGLFTSKNNLRFQISHFSVDPYTFIFSIVFV